MHVKSGDIEVFLELAEVCAGNLENKSGHYRGLSIRRYELG